MSERFGRRRLWGRLETGLDREISELKRATMRLDMHRFLDELVEEFARRISHELSLKLSVDDAWLNDLILESEEVEEFDETTVREALARVMLEAVEGARLVVLALASNGDYELRAMYRDGVTGVALVGGHHTIVGEHVVREFGGLRVSGEIYRL